MERRLLSPHWNVEHPRTSNRLVISSKQNTHGQFSSLCLCSQLIQRTGQAPVKGTTTQIALSLFFVEAKLGKRVKKVDHELDPYCQSPPQQIIDKILHPNLTHYNPSTQCIDKNDQTCARSR